STRDWSSDVCSSDLSDRFSGSCLKPGQLFFGGQIPEDYGWTFSKSERPTVGRERVAWGKVFIAAEPASFFPGRGVPKVDNAVRAFRDQPSAVRRKSQPGDVGRL